MINKVSNKIATARDLGKEEGLAEGLERGAKEKMKELVLNMKNQGLENNFIAKCLLVKSRMQFIYCICYLYKSPLNTSINEITELLNS